jgi:hypothetical protein
MYPAMTRTAGLAFLLSIGVVSTALGQSATPTTGNVGSATLSNGFPAGGGASALPSVQNSTTTSIPAATTTTSTSTTAATSTTGSSSGAGSGGGGGGTGGGSTGSGSASTAGAATSTGSAGNGSFVLCPPSGAPGLEPLFTGTDLSCAPQ